MEPVEREERDRERKIGDIIWNFWAMVEPVTWKRELT